MSPKEQEEEMSCWGGAEGGASKQQHQSGGELGLSFLCDDSKLHELPGPKFRSLRHLRQVLSVVMEMLEIKRVNQEVVPRSPGNESVYCTTVSTGTGGC